MRQAAVMAVFRPQRNDILIMTDNGGEHAASALDLAEAKALHGALGQALAVAEHATRPMAAVNGK